MVSDAVVPRITRSDQVLIEVEATAVDPRDLFAARGAILGADLTGTVLEVGRAVPHLSAGDAVWAACGGAMRRYVVADGKRVRRRPVGLDAPGAAALPFSGLVSLAIVKDRMRAVKKKADGAQITIVSERA